MKNFLLIGTGAASDPARLFGVLKRWLFEENEREAFRKNLHLRERPEFLAENTLSLKIKINYSNDQLTPKFNNTYIIKQVNNPSPINIKTNTTTKAQELNQSQNTSSDILAAKENSKGIIAAALIAAASGILVAVMYIAADLYKHYNPVTTTPESIEENDNDLLENQELLNILVQNMLAVLLTLSMLTILGEGSRNQRIKLGRLFA